MPQLSANFRKLFFIRALLNIKMINIVLSLFYIARGISLAQIFYLNLLWAAASFLFEIPSSYLADRWGRKKTMILGSVLALGQWSVLLFAHGFWWLSVSMVLYGLSYACMTGTDEALLYDTEKELGKESKTLRRLGRFRGAQNLFKIISPIIGAVIAQDLLDWQFQILIGVDLAGSFAAIWLASRLVEPRHHMDLEKQEAGVLRDAWTLLRKSPDLLRAILNKEIVFFAVFITWSYYQTFFTDLGLSIIFIGIVWGVRHGIVFLMNWIVREEGQHAVLLKTIDRYNLLFILFNGVFLLILFFNPLPVPLLIFFILANIIQGLTYPYFAEVFHKRFNSYNRATTLSLANALHNIIEFPMLLTAAWLIDIDVRYPFVFVFLLGMIAVFFVRLSPLEHQKKSVAF